MLGLITSVLAIFLLIPTVYAFILGTDDFHGFLYTLIIASVTGGLLAMIPKSKHSLKYRDSYALVTFGWLSAGLIGCLPYFFSNAIPGFTDAYFESISGFTTTGSSVLTKIEALHPATLFWRSLTQWLGGMGIIVFALAIIPYLNIGGMGIFQAEVPGPTAEKLTPRIQDTAKVLWMVYLIFTVMLTLLLWMGGMTFFDAICHSFTAMSTGGFSTKNNSVAGFNSPFIEWVLIIFMIIAGINFALHYRFLFKGFTLKTYTRDPELNFYFLIILFSIVTIVATILFQQGGNAIKVVRDVCFSVTSILTTTGYGTVDYELWPIYGQFILLFIMIMGGCAGSTAGGIKSVRLMLVLKYMYTEALKLLHPNLIRTVKMRNSVLDRNVLANILGFIFIYTAVMVVSILLVSLEINDMVTAIGSVVASLSNIGPGFGSVGPTENYAHLGIFTKWILSLDMVMGRLEILTILILFFPKTWQK
ncbi:MAG: TrkH family potassium uptake protein [Deltaproteobacteria bacterium]|nr:TrkH family potassium uptake protein [Deltaproteobacteria bacterium]